MGELGTLDPIPNTELNMNQSRKIKATQTKKTQNNGTNRKEKIIGTWNIRRGLIKRENEILEILTSQKLMYYF